MKTATANLDTHIQGIVLTTAFLFKAVRKDTTTYTFTSHDQDIDFDDGSGVLTYSSLHGFSRTAIQSTFDFAVDNLSFNAFLNSGGVTEDDILNGLWDNATIFIHLIDYTTPADGSIKHRRGEIGEISTADNLDAELRGMLQKFVIEIGILTSPTCRAIFGDEDDIVSKCYVDIVGTEWSASLALEGREDFDARLPSGTGEVVIRPTTPNDRWFVPTNDGTTGGSEPSWDTTIGNTTDDNGISFKTIQARRISTVVDVVTNSFEFTVTSTTDAPDAFFQSGFVHFTTGNNAGVRMGINSWVQSTKTITMFLPMTQEISPGDELDLIAGCDKLRDTCMNDYDNIFNFRGEPDIPGNDQIFRYPDAPPEG